MPDASAILCKTREKILDSTSDGIRCMLKAGFACRLRKACLWKLDRKPEGWEKEARRKKKEDGVKQRPDIAHALLLLASFF